MALSDELTKLAARAKEAETRAAAAQDKARGALEQEVSSARQSAQAQADKVREVAETGEGKISDWWTDVQRSWNQGFGGLRDEIERRKAEHDVHKAQRRAENAETEALLATRFAYSAVVEAEYAALDAALARLEADEASEKAGATSGSRS